MSFWLMLEENKNYYLKSVDGPELFFQLWMDHFLYVYEEHLHPSQEFCNFLGPSHIINYDKNCLILLEICT